MNNINLRCSNTECPLHEKLMQWPAGVPLVPCPLCNSEMEVAGESHWLVELANDEKYWITDAEEAYPAVIAYEYRNLRKFCREKQSYAVLLSLKDNFEALLKLEVLLAFAWAAQNGDEVFESQTVSQLMTPNLSLGAWVYLASVIRKDLNKAGMELPEAIPLEKVRKAYSDKEIVNWRNEKLGHGAMGMEEDNDFRQDILKRVKDLRDVFGIVDEALREQELILVDEEDVPKREQGSEPIDGVSNDPEVKALFNALILGLLKSGEKLPERGSSSFSQNSGSLSGDEKQNIILQGLSLTGADMARGLEKTGMVYFQKKDGSLSFCADPFITIRRHEKNGYGIYFFDNQRTKSLTYFLDYAVGTRRSENVLYFERLRKYLEDAGIKSGAMADDINLTKKEKQEIDLLQMSHSFVRPEHLVKWLRKCVEEHDRGIFLLQMERGTGKSVFTEKLSGLIDKPITIADDLDVRTYHFSRTQMSDFKDIQNFVEFLWGTEYTKEDFWIDMPHIADFVREGQSRGEALCTFLAAARDYSRRNRGKKRVLMVLDGLDEIAQEDLWEYIAEEQMPGEGVYFLLTSRNPEAEELTEDISERLNGLSVTEKYLVSRDGKENVSFLKEYVKKANIKGLNNKETDNLIALADFRVLQLGLLCRLAESGMSIAELPDSNRVVSVYLDTLEKRCGEKESVRFRELLAILCTLGMYEGLTLRTLGTLIGENGITLNLIGKVRDLAPMLKTERGEDGNLYRIANDDLAAELEKQIPETEDTVRWIICLAMSVMRDGNLDKERELEPVAAHVAELADEKLPEGMKALGRDADTVLWNNAIRESERVTERRSRERVLYYRFQTFLYHLRVFGEENQDTLETLYSIDNSLSDLGLYEEALGFEQYILEIKKKMPEIDDMSVLRSLSSVGITLQKLGRYEEALAIAQEVSEKRRNVLGDEDPDTLYAQSNLASVLNNLGRYEEALPIIKDAVGKAEIILGRENPDVLLMKINMLETPKYFSSDEEALSVSKELYEISRKLKGEEHPDTLTYYSNLAVIYQNLGKFEEALAIEQEVFEKSRIVLGKEHPDTLVTQLNIAISLIHLQRYDEALKIGRDVFEKFKTNLGEDHPATLHAQTIVAIALEELGYSEESLAMEKEVHKKMIKALGEGHPKTREMQDDLFAKLEERGLFEEKLKLAKEIYDIRKKERGVTDQDTLAMQVNIATSLQNMGRYEEALALEQEVLEFLVRDFGENDLTTQMVQIIIAFLLGSLERYEESCDVYQKIYESLDNLWMFNKDMALVQLNDYAWTLDKLGRYEEAISKQRELVSYRMDPNEEINRETAKSVVRLSEMYLHAGNNEKAAETAEQAREFMENNDIVDKEFANILDMVLGACRPLGS